MDVVLLSRLQFALTIMFHYLFPPLTIGRGIVLVWLEGMFLRTREPIYETAARFWTKIFALNFAVGVATGIVMEFEFGTNWAAYSRFVGDVFGSALAAEGIFAFFLESGFLAVLVFGWDRVGPRMHFFSTVMVALGSIFSSVWIVVANSWQQTPTGHHIVPMLRDGKPWIVDGEPVLRAEITEFWGLVFNPSTIHRLTHVLLGCFLMGAFFIMSISAWYLLKRRHEEFARRSFTGALILATVSCLAIAVSGDFQAKNVYRHQPAKLAAFEGLETTGPAGLAIVPGVEVPGLLSWLLHGDASEPVLGLDAFRPSTGRPSQSRSRPTGSWWGSGSSSSRSRSSPPGCDGGGRSFRRAGSCGSSSSRSGRRYLYQGGSDDFLAPTADVPVPDEDYGIDLEAEVRAVVTDDVPMATSAAGARGHIKLLMLMNDWSLRNLIPAELAKGFGFYQSKPATAFSPVAVTPDELGEAWDGGKVSLPLVSHVNGELFGHPEAGVDMTFDFPRLIEHVTRTRRLGAGAIVGSGTASNYDRSRGSSCLAERRMLEQIEHGRAITPFLRFGDRVRIEMLDRDGQSIFGAIDQKVVPAA